MKTSKDGGLSWSAPQALPEGYLGPVKNKPVLLSNDVLFCASSTEGNGWRVHFETTSDLGKTWKKIGPINDGKTMNAIQPSVLFYKDERMQTFAGAAIELYRIMVVDPGQTLGRLWPKNLANNNSGY